jgi:hypothetical protein
MQFRDEAKAFCLLFAQLPQCAKKFVIVTRRTDSGADEPVVTGVFCEHDGGASAGGVEPGGL